MSRSSHSVSQLAETEVLSRLARGGVPKGQRRQLVGRLRDVGTSASVETLIACGRSSDRRIRVTALRALMNIGTRPAIDGLITGLKSDDPVTMSFAAQHLARLDARVAIPALIHCLSRTESRRDKDGRWAVVYALSQLPHRDAVPVLADTLSDPHATTAKLAAVALRVIRAPEATEALADAVRDMSWWRSRYARRALRDVQRST